MSSLLRIGCQGSVSDGFRPLLALRAQLPGGGVPAYMSNFFCYRAFIPYFIHKGKLVFTLVLLCSKIMPIMVFKTPDPLL